MLKEIEKEEKVNPDSYPKVIGEMLTGSFKGVKANKSEGSFFRTPYTFSETRVMDGVTFTAGSDTLYVAGWRFFKKGTVKGD